MAAGKVAGCGVRAGVTMAVQAAVWVAAYFPECASLYRCNFETFRATLMFYILKKNQQRVAGRGGGSVTEYHQTQMHRTVF